jgi:hypothetical protein
MRSDVEARAGGAAPRPSRRAKLLRIAALLAVTPVLVEVGARTILAARGRPYDSGRAELEIADLVASMNDTVQTQARDRRATTEPEPAANESFVALHPYLGFDWSHNAERVALGLQYFEGAMADRTYDVFVFGGSVAAHFANNDGAAFVAELQKDPRLAGRPIRLLCEGRGGYKQPQQAIDLAYLLALGFEPDFVVELDGFNEAALASANAVQGASPAHPSVAHWSHIASIPTLDREAVDHLVAMRIAQTSAKRDLERAQACGAFRSAAAGTVVSRWIRGRQRVYVQAHGAYAARLAATGGVSIEGPKPPEDYDEAMRLALTTWKESSRAMAGMCRAIGVPYLHVLQPTLHDAGSKPLTDEERRFDDSAPGWIEGVVWAYPRMREMGRELEAEGIPFLDATQVFRDVEETLYYDICHFRSKGNQILAAAIAERVLELAGAVPEPRVASPRPRDGDRPPRRKRREKPPADVVDPPGDG